MARIKTFVVCLVVASLYAGARGQTPTAYELLQKGIYLEETVGDLEGAMRTYKQVTQMAVESRASAAQAEYRMGVCLQKKGQQAEAINTFRSLIKDYPEQADVVARAKASLPAEPKPVATTANPCQGLEDQIQGNPGETALREKTIDCYFNAQIRAQFSSPSGLELEKARVEHVLWLIQHAPDKKFAHHVPNSSFASAEHYIRVRRAWMNQAQTHPDDANVLASAAQFMDSDDREMAEELASKAHNLAPGNPQVTCILAEVHERTMNQQPELKVKMAQQALELREQVWNTTPRQHGKSDVLALQQLARDAFEAGENVKAQKYAEELSRHDDSDAIHHGNLILGRLALKNGNTEEAKKRLLMAGTVSGSPVLGSFGPNMMLAQELLQKGEQEVVLQYFDECQKFWKNDRNQLAKWRQAIHQDRIPNFGG